MRTNVARRFSPATENRLPETGNLALHTSARGTPGADLRIDADDRRSLGAGLGAEDLVIDAAGPLQGRSTLLPPGSRPREFVFLHPAARYRRSPRHSFDWYVDPDELVSWLARSGIPTFGIP